MAKYFILCDEQIKKNMKKIAMLFAFVASTLTLVGCEGPTGPQGPPGPTDYPFVEDIRASFDGDLNSFTQKIGEKHNSRVKVLDGDVLLVYVLNGTTKDGLPIWAPLPHRYFVDVDKVEKELEYSYDFSRYDYQIYANANTQLKYFTGSGAKDDPGFLKNMIFRLVYIPARDPINNTNAVKNTSNKTVLSYEEAVRKYNLEGVKVVKSY